MLLLLLCGISIGILREGFQLGNMFSREAQFVRQFVGSQLFYWLQLLILLLGTIVVVLHICLLLGNIRRSSSCRIPLPFEVIFRNESHPHTSYKHFSPW